MELWIGAGLACLGIAVGIGQWLIPPDKLVPKIRTGLIVLACVLALAGIVLLLYALLPQWRSSTDAEKQQLAIAKRKDRQRHEEIYLNLGVFLDTGERLKTKIMNERIKPVPSDELNRWASRTHLWIAEYVGPGQAALFSSPPELPCAKNGNTVTHENAWCWVEKHLAVIRGLIQITEFGMVEEKGS
jgi:hypothetical protein